VRDQQAALALAANGDLDEREYVVELFVREFTRGLDLDDSGGRLGPLSDHTESHYARSSLPLRWAFIHDEGVSEAAVLHI
jgi:hypothetical protein